MIGDKYYYHRLNEKNQFLYRLILKAVTDYTPIIQGHNQIQCSQDDLNAINNAIVLDNPYLFYYSGQIIIKNRGLTDFEIRLFFDFSQEKCIELQKRINTESLALLKAAKLEDKTEEERVRIIHDLLVSTITYDTDRGECFFADRSDEAKYAHSILGVLINKKAVCDGIAKAYKYLLNAINIGCIVVPGISKSPLIPRMNSKHAWNIVKIEGDNYYTDITWDIIEFRKGLICYDYYNLTEEQIRKDHFGFDSYPVCNSREYNYFYRTQTIMYSERMMLAYIDRCIQSRVQEIYIRLEFDCDFKKTIVLVKKHIQDYLSFIKRTEVIQYYYRDIQKIIRIVFVQT